MAKRFIGNVKGVGVSDFSWEYYLSSSSAVLDGGSWSATPPTLGNNKYLWMRSKVTLTDGTIQYTVPVCEGVWEEIYGIYAIGDKVDGALSDVTDLKSRMTTEENKVQPLNKGGTGATTAEAARENLGVKKCGEFDVLPIAQGGTGATTAAAALEKLGLDSIGKFYEQHFDAIAIPVNTSKALASLTLPAGTYVVEGGSSWNVDNRNMYIMAFIRDVTAGQEIAMNRGVMIAGGGLMPTAVVKFDVESTITMYAYWGGGSGTARHNSDYLRAVKVK